MGVCVKNTRGLTPKLGQFRLELRCKAFSVKPMFSELLTIYTQSELNARCSKVVVHAVHVNCSEFGLCPEAFLDSMAHEPRD